MANQNELAGAVLLEAFWATRKRDMLDLLAPFVQFAVAKNTCVGQVIDINRITDIIRNDFHYKDIPASVIEKIIKRDKEHFVRNNHRFILQKTFDYEIERFESRQKECLEKLTSVGQELYDFLILHCKKAKIKNTDHAIELLQQFFSSFALQIGLDILALTKFSSASEEIQYYIAQFIFEKKTEGSKTYGTILDLTKGFLLQSALYLQGDNTDISAASYKSTKVFYDTPFLLQLLGYQSSEEESAAKELHNLLKRQGAQLFLFPQNEQEVLSVLTAYQYSLLGDQRSTRTLVGLDSRGYSFDGVTRLKNNLSKTLYDTFGIILHEVPSLPTNPNGTVDIAAIDFSESDAIEYVRAHTSHYKEENLQSDITSALGIHRIRGGYLSQTIERCRAIFLTTNNDFTKAFNAYYREAVGSNCVMPVITAFDLSAIVWVKAGCVDSEIPERQLLINAYSAMQPAPEIMEKCRVVLNQMEAEGKLSKEDAISLRADRVTQKELWLDYFPDIDTIDEEYIQKLIEKQRQKLIGDAEAKIKKKYVEQEEEQRLQRAKRIQNKANTDAKEARETYKKRWKLFVFVAFLLIAIVCSIGLFMSLSSVALNVFLWAFIVVSIISIIDTLRSKGFFINQWIEKRANAYETKIRDKKIEEYEKI